MSDLHFELVDYSGLLSHDALTRPSARARRGKFMLVEMTETIYLVMGVVSVYEYHADLLAKFCQFKALTYTWVSRPANLKIGDESVILHGGGWMEVNPESKTVAFSGRSTAYGGYDKEVLQKLLKTLSAPTGTKLLVE